MSDASVTSLYLHLPEGAGYPVTFGPLDEMPPALTELGLRTGRLVLVTDTHVGEIYGPHLEDLLAAAGWDVLTITVPAGERSKSRLQLAAIEDRVLEWSVDRKTPLVALGGGVVGDLAGFAAAGLLRGLPLVHVPTSLLAQVDSSIGGKTGINHATGKNLLGAFHQPRLVWTDIRTLDTLPDREWFGGTAEIVKHALIGGDPLLSLLEEGPGLQRGASKDRIERIIREAVAVKISVVEADERETGIRAHLNFGHTFGHALERTLGYGNITHGEAVAVGMRAALFLSRERKPELPVQRLLALVDSVPVPAIAADIDIQDLMDAMRSDKKAEAGSLRYVLLDAVGRPAIVSDLSREQVQAAWSFALRRDE